MPNEPNGNDDRDDVTVDVADALTRNQAVHWERCARLATPANRRSLDNLRALSGALVGRDPSGETSPAGDYAPYAGPFVRRAVQAVVAIAAVEVAAGLLLLPWHWDAYHREHGEFASFTATKLLGHAATACLLLLAGRREPRSRLLGVYCLFKATQAPQFMLPAFLLEMPPPPLYGTFLVEMSPAVQLFAVLYLPIFLFAPAVLWAFARECPRVHRRTRLDDLTRRMVPVSVLLGFVGWAVGGAMLLLPPAGWIEPSPPVSDGIQAGTDLLALAAVVAVALRAHTAPAEEVRRVALFSAGFLLYLGVSAAYDLAEAFRPGHWIVNYQWSPTVAAMEVMRFPGMVLLWYSVLAVRVPHVREVARECGRRLLARSGPLVAAAFVPALALAWLVASRAERLVGEIIEAPLAQSLFAAAVLLLLAAAGREPLLHRLDAWAYPEAPEQRRALAAASAALAQAKRMTTVGRTVTRAVKHGCGSAATLLAATDPGTHAGVFQATDARVGPLPRTSAIVHMLETAAGTLRVHPDDETSFFALLPATEAAWVLEADADAIVPVPGPGGVLVGVLAVGRRFDDRKVRCADLPFLEALATAAGLALGGLRAPRTAADASPEAPPAKECPACGYVVAPDEPPGCGCGSAYVEAEGPKLLADKFELTRRLGAGGTGTAYLARDLRLKRNVAVKTLTGISVFGLLGIKPEAWAMAEVTHPAVAQVHGIESWRGHPFLVVEYLAGGTLADRLREGPVPEPDAVSIAAALAGALAALHETGYVHGDVKPSNIGFAADGSPKLIDFGLAREANSGGVAGGTLRYASPEVVSGQPAAEADDIWSLAVVLYEMVAGEHPFAGDDTDAVGVTERIRAGASAGAGASARIPRSRRRSWRSPRRYSPPTTRRARPRHRRSPRPCGPPSPSGELPPDRSVSAVAPVRRDEHPRLGAGQVQFTQVAVQLIVQRAACGNMAFLLYWIHRTVQQVAVGLQNAPQEMLDSCP